MSRRLKGIYTAPAVGDVHVRSGVQMREYEAIVARIVADRPAKLLDWGCGLGQVTDLLSGAGVETVAFDYTPSIERDDWYQLERYPGLRAFLSRDPVRLPFSDHSFAAVLSCGVLEHVSDPDTSLAELHRILEPGGTLYVYKLPHRRSYLERLARWSGRLYYHGADPHDAIYTFYGARRLLERHGFRVLDERLANMLPLTGGVHFSERVVDAVWWINRALARVPGVNELATNIELIAQRG